MVLAPAPPDKLPRSPGGARTAGRASQPPASDLDGLVALVRWLAGADAASFVDAAGLLRPVGIVDAAGLLRPVGGADAAGLLRPVGGGGAEAGDGHRAPERRPSSSRCRLDAGTVGALLNGTLPWCRVPPPPATTDAALVGLPNRSGRRDPGGGGLVVVSRLRHPLADADLDLAGSVAAVWAARGGLPCRPEPARDHETAGQLGEALGALHAAGLLLHQGASGGGSQGEQVPRALFERVTAELGTAIRSLQLAALRLART